MVLIDARNATMAGIRLLALAILLAACGPGASSSVPSSSVGGSSPSGSAAGARPSSPATVRIGQPSSGQTVTGSSIHVVIDLQGATIVPATTTNLNPTEGHLHLYLDNVLVSMNYGLEQDVPVHPGTHFVKAEFVAADHAPFAPRVWSSDVVFTVK